MSIITAHSRTYTSRLIASGILAMLFIISRMVSAFLIGSSCASCISREALKRIKSVAWSCRYITRSSYAVLRAKLSGSSPSGKEQTFTFIPCSRIRSIPRIEARKPAASPSYSTVMLGVRRCISLIWSGVRAVPLEATTFSIPFWWSCITSV